MGDYVIYEIGFDVSYRIPKWRRKDFDDWARGNMGVYFKNSFGVNPMQTFGFSFKSAMDSFSGIFLARTGLVFARDFAEMGIEVEFSFGYDIYFSDWIISPNLTCNFSPTLNFLDYETSSIERPHYKSLLYFGVSIGRLFW